MKRTTIRLHDGTTVVKAESPFAGFLWAAVQKGDKTDQITAQDFKDLVEMDKQYRQANGMAPAEEEVVESTVGGRR
jgi:hypothetical protein